MKRLFRLVIFVNDDLRNFVALNSKGKINVQIGIAENNSEMLDTALEKPVKQH